MKQLSAVLFPVAIAHVVAAADLPRPRGVGPEFAKYYKDASTFTCISNPSVQIPSNRINDDFCDCPDGSDEPGTAACSYLSPLSPSTPGDSFSSSRGANTTLALPGFYCKNKGHQPAYVPFTYINDGVCDHDLCCDGSDEWARVGGVKCDDRCKEIGKEWRKKDESRQKSIGVALKRRKELAGEAARLRQEVFTRIQSLETEIEGAEVKIKGLKSTLEEVERQERGKVVKKPKEGGKLGILVQLAKDRAGELRDALIEVRGQRDIGRERVKELEAILSTFKEEYNPNFNDEGVKRAVRAWEDYAAKEKTELSNDARDRDLDEIAKPEGEGGVIDWKAFEELEEKGTDTDILYQFEAYLPPSVRDWIDRRLRDLRILLIENGILAGSASSDPDSPSPEVESARTALRSAEDDLANNQRQLTSHRDDLAKDYGTDDIFRALKDRCIEKDSGEYTYELCFLGGTKQKSKKGGAHTGMGQFVQFDTILVDNDDSNEFTLDGKSQGGSGSGNSERVVMKYENGQHCWNGPARSTLVVLACSETEEVWKITEEEKCVYRMDVGTSAVCRSSGSSGSEGGSAGAEAKGKDEL